MSLQLYASTILHRKTLEGTTKSAVMQKGQQGDSQWRHARTQRMNVSWFGNVDSDGTEQNDRYTFDLIMNKSYRYGAGEFEIVMAYGEMNFADTDDFGSIGLHGNYGPLDIFGFPYGQETGVSAAYNDLSTMVKRNKVICYDYTGPEATQFDLSFQLRVAETAAGQNLPLTFISDVSGMTQKVMTNTIAVAGNIQLASFQPVKINENGSFELVVAYADADANPNTISVTGNHIQAIVNDHQSGSRITVKPQAHWHGDTTVTVKVADRLNPADAALQSFELTVVSDGVELGCTDSTATNFNAAANQNDGSCKYPPKPVVEAPASSSGGAASWLLLLLIPLFHRRKLLRPQPSKVA